MSEQRGDCLAMRHFPRIPGHRGGDAVCSKTDGHTDAHEGTVGRTAYCWTNTATLTPADPWDACLDVDPWTGQPEHGDADMENAMAYRLPVRYVTGQHIHGDACEGNCE